MGLALSFWSFATAKKTSLPRISSLHRHYSHHTGSSTWSRVAETSPPLLSSCCNSTDICRIALFYGILKSLRRQASWQLYESPRGRVELQPQRSPPPPAPPLCIVTRLPAGGLVAVISHVGSAFAQTSPPPLPKIPYCITLRHPRSFSLLRDEHRPSPSAPPLVFFIPWFPLLRKENMVNRECGRYTYPNGFTAFCLRLIARLAIEDRAHLSDPKSLSEQTSQEFYESVKAELDSGQQWRRLREVVGQLCRNFREIYTKGSVVNGFFKSFSSLLPWLFMATVKCFRWGKLECGQLHAFLLSPVPCGERTAGNAQGNKV